MYDIPDLCDISQRCDVQRSPCGAYNADMYSKNEIYLSENVAGLVSILIFF